MKFLIRNRSRLKCPKCGARLIAAAHQSAEIDRCGQCGGAWLDPFDFGVLLGTRRDLASYVPQDLQQWQSSKRACPMCSSPMRTLARNDFIPFELDQCPEDKGVWVDGGELEPLLAAAERAPLRLKPREQPEPGTSTSPIVEGVLARARLQAVLRRRPEGDSELLENTSFFRLPLAKKLVALLGLPVESGRTCEWLSWMNMALILANLSMFVWMVMSLQSPVLGLFGAFPPDWYYGLGFVPARFLESPADDALTLLTSMFTHGGLLHLVFNMFFLFTCGDDVEKRFGWFAYFFFYLGCGFACALASALSGVDAHVPHVGASGAISGVMGAYMVLCRHKSFYVWAFRVFLFGKMVSVSAWIWIAYWFCLQVVYAFTTNSRIDYWGHIGGFIAGWGIGCVVKRLQKFNVYTNSWEWSWRVPTRENP